MLAIFLNSFAKRKIRTVYTLNPVFAFHRGLLLMIQTRCEIGHSQAVNAEDKRHCVGWICSIHASFLTRLLLVCKPHERLFNRTRKNGTRE